MIKIHLIHADLDTPNATIPQDIDVVMSDPPFALGGVDKIERLYNRKKDSLVLGYNETVSPHSFYRNLVGHAETSLNKTGIGLFVSGWTHYHTLRCAIDQSGLTMMNDMVFPYSFGVYAPRRFVTSHYNGALVERKKGKGRVARHHLSRNKQQPYSLDVIPFKRQYRTGLPRYVNTLSTDLAGRLAWHLVPDGARVLDLCCGACGFAQGILLTREICSAEMWCMDNNDKVLELAAGLLRESAEKLGRSLVIEES